MSEITSSIEKPRLWNIINKNIVKHDLIQYTPEINTLFNSLVTEYSTRIKNERTTKNVRNYQKSILQLCKGEIDKHIHNLKQNDNITSQVYTKEDLMAQRNSKFNTELDRRKNEFMEYQPKQPDLIDFSETRKEHDKDIETLMDAEIKRRNYDINAFIDRYDPTVAKEWIQNKEQFDMKHNNMEQTPNEKLSIPSHLKSNTNSSADDDHLRKKRDAKKREKAVNFLQSINTRDDVLQEPMEEITFNIVDKKDNGEESTPTKLKSKNITVICGDSGSLEPIKERNSQKYNIKKMVLSNKQGYFIDENEVSLSHLNELFIKANNSFVPFILRKECKSYITYKTYEECLFEGSTIDIYYAPESSCKLTIKNNECTIDCRPYMSLNDSRKENTNNEKIIQAGDECFCVFLSMKLKEKSFTIKIHDQYYKVLDEFPCILEDNMITDGDTMYCLVIKMKLDDYTTFKEQEDTTYREKYKNYICIH